MRRTEVEIQGKTASFQKAQGYKRISMVCNFYSKIQHSLFQFRGNGWVLRWNEIFQIVQGLQILKSQGCQSYLRGGAVIACHPVGTILTADLQVSRKITKATTQQRQMWIPQLQDHLNDIQKWLKTWRVKGNETKSTHVTFTLENKIIPVVLNGVKIPQVTTVKYYGMDKSHQIWVQTAKNRALKNMLAHWVEIYTIYGQQSFALLGDFQTNLDLWDTTLVNFTKFLFKNTKMYSEPCLVLCQFVAS